MTSEAHPKTPVARPIDWSGVRSVLVVKLRSIGDTVLSTPSLAALRRHLPDARIDVLLEDWVAPVLEGLELIDEVVTVGKGLAARLRVVGELRRRSYDIAFSLHGGTTATLITAASGAKHRVGFSSYQYSFLFNHAYPAPDVFWGRPGMHSAEQQLALLGWAGVPVKDGPKTRLAVSPSAAASMNERLQAAHCGDRPVALLHPTTAFFTKQWPVDRYARVAEHLHELGFCVAAIASRAESGTLRELKAGAGVPVLCFDDLSLPEITALAARSGIFVGNDSGMAHIAAAVRAPTVVIFGSSNRVHWSPWTDAPSEVVYQPFDCQPCPGYRCEAYGEPQCILTVPVEAVIAAVDRLMGQKKDPQ